MSLTPRKQLILKIGEDPNADGYGTTNLPGITEGDDYELVIDKLTETVDGLAPPVPTFSLGNVVITSVNSTAITDARFADTGGTLANGVTAGSNISATSLVLFDTNDTGGNTPAVVTTNQFYNAEAGTIQFQVLDDVDVVVDAGHSEVLAPGTTFPINTGGFLISQKIDAYTGGTGESFYFYLDGFTLTSATGLTADTETSYNYRVTHTDPSAETLDYEFYVDTFATPGITADPTQPLLIGTHNPFLISGVPTPTIGDDLGFKCTVQNAVDFFYHTNKLFTMSEAAAIVTGADLDHNITPSSNVDVAIDYTAYTLILLTDAVTENVQIDLITYNTIDTPSSIANLTRAGDTMRYDGYQDETVKRIKSGEGQYPSIGVGAADAGDTYSTAGLIGTIALSSYTSGYGDELQYVGGVFKLPNTSYTNNYPTAGPNYTGLATSNTEAGNSYRYVTTKTTMTGTDADPTSIKIIIDNPVGIWNESVNGFTITQDMRLYVKVRDASDTTDLTTWIDGNLLFEYIVDTTDYDIGTGSDGVAGGVPSYINLGNFDREISLGSTRVGDVVIYVRLGIPTDGNDKEFSDITVTKYS